MTHAALPSGPLNKTRLINAVAIELDTTHTNARAAVEAVLNTITRNLVAGHGVTITNFGAWHPHTRPQREAHNPRTGTPVTVPPTRAVKWTTSPQLRAHLQHGNPAAVSIRKRPRGSRTN